MMKLRMIRVFGLGLLTGMVFLAGVAFKNSDNGGVATIGKNGKVQYKWYPPETPDNMAFAGEKVPLNRPAVREALERELLINYYSHAHTLDILRLTTRIFPVIEARLEANGVPEDFKYLCVAESSLRNPTSRAGAVGYWQFMEATARQYGLEIDREVDERYSLEKATDAACAYLKDAYAKFGNWTAAAASYNCGMGGFGRRSDFQRSKSYYDLMLPEETNRYIFRILALKALLSHPKKYGYFVPAADARLPRKVKKITVTQSISNLSDFAIEHGTSYKILRLLNPWLRSKSLTISKGNSYVIALPKN